DIVKYALDEYGNGENAKINTTNASQADLKDFSNVYCELLNNIYASKKGKYLLEKILDGDGYFGCEIRFVDKDTWEIEPKFERIEMPLNNLLSEWNPSNSGKITKMLRIYNDNNNTIRIIKPKQLRYWLKSKALRDADETFDDILGY
ncbi:MAG: hypothetical protein LBV16_04530, partial [Elusimicrobiota bacterium]|nr:hypothetical protein [Elusimicrobiota bacterium]